MEAEITNIFNGAAWLGSERNGLMILKVTTRGVYGACLKYDFEAESKEEALEMLVRWGFRYVGAE